MSIAHPAAVLSALVLLAASAARGVAADRDGAAVANREPLATTPLVRLPLGNVRADGWLLTQLQLQRDGLTGHAEQVIPQLGPGSGWLGGTGKDAESWEKGPYYVKGLVALAYTLDDAGLKRKAQKWVDWSIASQRPDGQFGPAGNDDWWPRMVMTYALRQYAEATGDPRVVPMLQKYLHYAAANLPKRHLREWGKARAGDQIDTAFWVYNRTGDPVVLAAADLLHSQAYDWTDIYTNNRFLEVGRSDLMPKHAVNVTQALKMPAVWSQRSHDAADRAAFAAGMAHLLADTALPLSVPTGTECLAGRSAIQGVETCTVVEQMLSDETVFSILGDAAVADLLERTAYNALPGAMTKDLKQYQYYTPTNNVDARRSPQGFNQDYGDGFMPGPVSGFPCCCYNLHMGWPMLVQNSWMATADGGLAAAVYAPTTVTAKLPAGEVTIREATNYPFEEAVRFTVSVARPATFPLQLRVPAWCGDATLSVNGKPEPRPAPGFVTLRREWRDGDAVELRLPMAVQTIPSVNRSVAVARGPLVFSLAVPEQTHVAKPGPDGFVQLELSTSSPWNYALAIDPKNPAAVTVHTRPMPAGNPFTPANSPVTLTVPARVVPTWGLIWTGHAAQDPPVSPVRSDEPERAITLVPFGAQTLRVTAFPVLGTPAEPTATYVCDFPGPSAPDWVAYGGGWYVRDSKLHAAPNTGGDYGVHGVKSVATAADFADLTYDADVTPNKTGDTGLIFRVARPAIGPNAFDGYYAGVNPSTGRVVLGRCDAARNEWTPIADAAATAKAGEPVHLRVVAVGPKITVTVGDAADPQLTATDGTFARGSVGVRCYTTEAAATRAAWGRIAVARQR